MAERAAFVPALTAGAVGLAYVAGTQYAVEKLVTPSGGTPASVNAAGAVVPAVPAKPAMVSPAICAAGQAALGVGGFFALRKMAPTVAAGLLGGAVIATGLTLIGMAKLNAYKAQIQAQIAAGIRVPGSPLGIPMAQQRQYQNVG